MAIWLRGACLWGPRLGLKGIVGSNKASKTNLRTSQNLEIWLYELGGDWDVTLVRSEGFKIMAIWLRSACLWGPRLGLKGIVGSDKASETNLRTSQNLEIWLYELGGDWDVALVRSEIFKIMAIWLRGACLWGPRLGIKGIVGSDKASETNLRTSQNLEIWLYELVCWLKCGLSLVFNDAQTIDFVAKWVRG
jgi:hypothetical protein